LNHEIGRQTIAIRNIKIHKDWKPNILSFDADIALLELDEELTFGTYIQPICLIEPKSDMEQINKGFVAGYGKSEFNDVETIARVVDMPIHSYHECLNSPDHVKLLSHRMFCGGYANSTGVCVGDSGSGLHVAYKNRYYLRGIVSASLNGEFYGCNVDAYSVFTDAIKHLNFIKTGNV
jgi:secreted trypsin-like serine protease